jgi:hypothetical protein
MKAEPCNIYMTAYPHMVIGLFCCGKFFGIPRKGADRLLIVEESECEPLEKVEEYENFCEMCSCCHKDLVKRLNEILEEKENGLHDS